MDLPTVFSLSSAVVNFVKDACLENLLDTCVSYFSSTGCYDLDVHMRIEVPNAVQTCMFLGSVEIENRYKHP
jgi:hypothetical protein